MFNQRPYSIDASTEWLNRATGLIPAYTQTLAKGPQQHIRGFAPAYAAYGRGGHLVDVDGNMFIDLEMAIGPISLGYAYPEVDAAIRAQLESGITFSLMHPLEVEVAELIRDVVPHVEHVRFSKTGCDVTSAAVRLARAYTGRQTVLCCGYHGWHDWYIGTTDRHKGVPIPTRELTYTFAYNDIASLLDAIDDDVAAVILEPMVAEMPHPGYLQQIRDICDERGILLVFDEMWTGFRFALGGAQEYFGVRADLVCFSKAIANGMPLSVLAGRADIMSLLERDVFFFTTFGGEALSLAAAKATITVMRRDDVHRALAEKGERLRGSIISILQEHEISSVSCIGHPSRTLLVFRGNEPLHSKSFVQQELLRRGILWNGFHTLCHAHSEDDISKVVHAYQEVLPILKEAEASDTVLQRLEGAPLEQVFRRSSQFNTKPRAAQL